MSRKDEGGHAFPVASWEGIMEDPDEPGKFGRGGIAGSRGMTLRDYFAAKAMQGIISAYGEDWECKHHCDIATDSYSIADLMLEARKS